MVQKEVAIATASLRETVLQLEAQLGIVLDIVRQQEKTIQQLQEIILCNRKTEVEPEPLSYETLDTSEATSHSGNKLNEKKYEEEEEKDTQSTLIPVEVPSLAEFTLVPFHTGEAKDIEDVIQPAERQSLEFIPKIPREALEIDDCEIGQGFTSIVRRGMYNGVNVAIKEINTAMSIEHQLYVVESECRTMR